MLNMYSMIFGSSHISHGNTGADPGFGNGGGGGGKILSVAHKSIPGFFRILNCTPLVFVFSEATIKVYTWIFFLKPL